MAAEGRMSASEMASTQAVKAGAALDEHADRFHASTLTKMSWEPCYNWDMSQYDGFYPWGDCVCCYFDCAMCGFFEAAPLDPPPPPTPFPMPLLAPCVYVDPTSPGAFVPDFFKAVCCSCVLMAQTYQRMIGETVTDASCSGPRCYDGTVHDVCVKQLGLGDASGPFACMAACCILSSFKSMDIGCAITERRYVMKRYNVPGWDNCFCWLLGVCAPCATYQHHALVKTYHASLLANAGSSGGPPAPDAPDAGAMARS